MGTTPQAPATQRSIQTAQLITAMLKSGSHVSDLIFSPGRAPQIEVSGELVELKFKGLECLSAEPPNAWQTIREVGRAILFQLP